MTRMKGKFTVTANEKTLEHLRKHHNSLDISEFTVFILEEIILREILGLSESQASSNGNLKYFQNADSAFDAVNSGEWDAAFLLDPVPLNDLFSLTKAGGILPQKSTYFYPKVATGLVVRTMERS